MVSRHHYAPYRGLVLYPLWIIEFLCLGVGIAIAAYQFVYFTNLRKDELHSYERGYILNFIIPALLAFHCLPFVLTMAEMIFYIAKHLPAGVFLTTSVSKLLIWVGFGVFSSITRRGDNAKGVTYKQSWIVMGIDGIAGLAFFALFLYSCIVCHDSRQSAGNYKDMADQPYQNNGTASHPLIAQPYDTVENPVMQRGGQGAHYPSDAHYEGFRHDASSEHQQAQDFRDTPHGDSDHVIPLQLSMKHHDRHSYEMGGGNGHMNPKRMSAHAMV